MLGVRLGIGIHILPYKSIELITTHAITPPKRKMSAQRMRLLEMILATMRKVKNVTHIIMLATAAAMIDVVLSPSMVGTCAFEPMLSESESSGKIRGAGLGVTAVGVVDVCRKAPHGRAKLTSCWLQL
jgi:hypothetical protein